MVNSALCLAVYLMADHGYTPEEAIKPFTRLHPCPLTGYVDATWQEPTYKLHVLSCLKGLYKAVDLGFLSAGPMAALVDTFDYFGYVRCDDPRIMNMNQVL